MKRRLLYLSLSSTQFGGGEVYLLHHLRHFRQEYDVFVACAAENTTMTERVRALGLPYLEVSQSYYHLPSSMLKLCQWHLEHDFHLIHANGRRSQTFGALLARRFGVPVVGADLVANLTWSGSLPKKMQNLSAVIFNRLLAVPWLTRITTICEYVRQERVRYMRVAAGRVVTVYNAVDSENFVPSAADPQLAAQLGIPPGSKVIACSARFVEHKGHKTLLEALAQLKDEPCVLLLIGEGPYEDEIRRCMRALGLEKRCFIVGFPSDIRPYFALAEVVVLASREEGLPTSLLQAMAMARPVLGTEVQGIPEVITPGFNGYLFPPGASQALAARLRELLGDPLLCKRLGANGRSRVMEDFTLAKMLEGSANVYRSALGLGGANVTPFPSFLKKT